MGVIDNLDWWYFYYPSCRAIYLDMNEYLFLNNFN